MMLRDDVDTTLPAVAVFDLETTGVDPEVDRIVQAHVGVLHPENPLQNHQRAWLVNPGIPIPAAATQVHRITDAMVADGLPAATAVQQIVDHLADLVDAGFPLVIYNASYDLTLLDRESRRHLGAGVPWLDDVHVLDPMVIDKGLDPYRRGSRKLADVARHYGLDVDDASLHSAGADAVLAGRLMLHLWRHTDVFGYPAAHLHERQIAHARQQRASFADYLHSEGRHEEALAVRTTWPYHPIGEES